MDGFVADVTDPVTNSTVAFGSTSMISDSSFAISFVDANDAALSMVVHSATCVFVVAVA